MKLKVIDLFSGAGGLSEGILQTDKVEILGHVEWDISMVKTLRHRLITKFHETEESVLNKVVHFDIQQVNELLHGFKDKDSVYKKTNSDLFIEKGLYGLLNDQDIDVIVGGPPCQAYSIAGRAQDKFGMKQDYRNYLFLSFSEIVNNIKPKVFVFENVEGILTAKPNGVLVVNEIYEAFAKIGYRILPPDQLKNAIFNSKYYDVPQDRKRVIIFGVREDLNLSLDSLYSSLRSFANNNILTVRDAIGDFPKIYPLQEIKREKNKNISHEIVKCSLKNHVSRFINKKNQDIFYDWVKHDLNKLKTQEKNDYYFQKTGKKTNHPKYRSLYWDQPSPTIVAHLHKDGYMFIHPDAEQKRSITVREAAKLMSFPDDFEFVTSESSSFKMIGNAVPVNFAKYIGYTLIKALL